MSRPYPRIDAQLFKGWSDARLAAYAKKRIAHYQRPGGPFTPGEKALLREAWGYGLRQLRPAQRSRAACPPSLSKKSRRNR